MFWVSYFYNIPADINLQAYQRLCEWRHGIGSAALALFTSFFAGMADDAIEHTAQQLLEKFTFLYEDFNITEPDKAFRSDFITQLLATTHLCSIKGHVDVPIFGTDVKGIIGICGAAVPNFILILFRV